MKSGNRMALALLLLAFTAGVSLVYPYSAAAEKTAAPSTVKKGEYVIGTEDVLDILVWKNVELSRLVTVRPDGMISLPLLGDIQAAGRTPDELRIEIVKKIKNYQKSAEVAVIVQEVNSRRIFIVGDITNPGAYPIKSRTTVLQAIAMAGGFNQFASKNSLVLIRENGDGKRKKIKIRFGDIVNVKKDKDNNLILMPGDTIFVP
ncbi:MAG: polysaccharide biosynthesis/export family protein [Nitrospinota bacterium]